MHCPWLKFNVNRVFHSVHKAQVEGDFHRPFIAFFESEMTQDVEDEQLNLYLAMQILNRFTLSVRY